MRTFKRKIVDIDTSVNNISKYSNQLTFTGIKQSENIYEVDQKSQMDTLNVYVNDENTLISREPLVEDNMYIPYPTRIVDGKTENYGQLIDIKECNNVRVFVFDIVGEYKIVAKRDDEIAELTATEYHLALFNQYIICFRTEGAQVIDTNNASLYWRILDNYIETPITKIITGSLTKEETTNQFTKDYIHRYVRTNDLNTVLPPASNVSISGQIITDKGSQNYNINELSRIWKHTDYRLLNQLPITINEPYNVTQDDEEIKDIILAAENTLIIARVGYFLVSYDNGQTYTKVTYPTTFIRPTDNAVKFAKDLKAISEDGQNFFYCTALGVYRCSLSDYSWTKFTVHNTTTSGYNGLNIVNETEVYFSQKYCFKNAEVFCFACNNRIYYKAPGMSDTSANYNNTLCYYEISSNINNFKNEYFRNNDSLVKNHSVKININSNGNGYLVYADDNGTYSQITANSVTGTFYAIIGQGTNATVSVYTGSGPSTLNLYPSTTTPWGITVEEIEYLDVYNNYSANAIKINGVLGRINGYIDSANTDGTGYYEYEYVIGHSSDTSLGDYINNIDRLILGTKLLQYYDANYGFPIKVTKNLYIGSVSNRLIDVIELLSLIQYEGDFPNNEEYTYSLVYPNVDFVTNSKILVTNTSIYAYNNDSSQSNNYIFTNKLSNNAIINIDYKYNSDQQYQEVPTLSYSGSELFLAFDNTLMITKNTKDGSNILFNLPKINNQDFVDNITNMINISTSELAIFFKNNILICTRQSDETFSYVYTYNKTRLSLGVRLGDDVINTLDGANSVFPTIRGLAIMNYQAYMATTDQMLTFATDNINQLWNEFYSKSSNIKIIQMRNYIYLSNGTNEYLMFDVRTASWWKFKIPFAITKMLTDQLCLNIISSKLYKIDNAFNKNKYIDCDDNHIDWYIVSQRLHFGVPNHYKNLKQLIFQLVQSNNFQNTINTEIKLYRKTITYKEPEMIRFKIDEFKTVVKRFNYWKINELQWALSSDNNTNIPAQLILNGIDIKYEIGEEVR